MTPAQHGTRVAFFGGSFDPPHLGHLAVARAARTALKLDAVLFAPVGAQPLKRQGATASFDHRLTMARLAVAGEPGFEVSLIDAPRADRPSRPNYTIDTLNLLRAVLQPGSELFCLMGADSYLGLRQWHRAAEIPFAASMVVASRPGQPLDDLGFALPEGLRLEPLQEASADGVELREFTIQDDSRRAARFYLLPGVHADISATAIRAALNTGASRELVPPAVTEYIRDHRLYGTGG